MNKALGKKPPNTSNTHAGTVMELVHYRTALLELAKSLDSFELITNCDIQTLRALGKMLAKQARKSAGEEGERV